MLATRKCVARVQFFSLCRFCSKSDKPKVPKVVDKTAASDKPDSAPAASVSSESLIQQILSMKISGSKKEGDSSDLDLARPSGKWKKIRKDLVSKTAQPEDLDPKMVSAVKEVANCLGGNTDTVESELLQKLRDHESDTLEIKSSFSMGEIFSGMKIDRSQKKYASKGKIVSEENDAAAHMIQMSSRKMWGESQQDDTSISSQLKSSFQRSKEDRRRSHGIDIFGADLLNIFNQTTTSDNSTKLAFQPLQTWDRLEQKSRKLSVTHPPANGFEEMIQWTEQGKLWLFPIDNEQGLEDEASVGFHEHIFLEKHIADFPRKGPVRHFMELVLIGLSKNPYYTVQEKIEHIDWFRQYFKTHEELLKEAGALG